LIKILFDLDDTLYPEKQYIYQGFWAVAQYFQSKYRLEATKVYLELVFIFKKQSKRVFDDFLKENNIDEDPRYIVNIYRSAKRNLSLYSDVLENLKFQKKIGNKLILVTNGHSEVQKGKIRNLKLAEYFDDIFILDNFGKEYWKPSVLIFDNIYDKYKGDLADYIFVGNGQEDLEFAKKIGIRFIFVDRENSVRKAEIENEQEIYIVRNLEELIKELRYK